MNQFWMTAGEAAATLGVRVDTLYAYVSRGVIAREKVLDSNGRTTSVFDRDEVLALVASRRRGNVGGTAHLTESDVSQLDPRGHLTYRGRELRDLVSAGFEFTVAVLLDTHRPWPESAIDTSENSGDSGGHDALDAIRIMLIRSAERDPNRADLSAQHDRDVAFEAIERACVAVTGLPSGAGTVAERLARHWTDGTQQEVVNSIDATLCVLAEHELTGSTLAARAAASVGADPWMALLAGHSALGGANHGCAAIAATDLTLAWLDERTVPIPPDSRHRRLPGFGHVVYRGPDPRAMVLLEAARELDRGLVDEIEELIVAVARTYSLHPNVDLGIAAVTLGSGLPSSAGPTLYGIARLAGLSAHIMEEYAREAFRLRPRAAPGVPFKNRDLGAASG